MTARRGPIRTIVEAAAVLAVLLGSAWLVFRGTLYRPPAGAALAHAAEDPKVDEAIVVAVAGDVVRLSPTGGKRFSKVSLASFMAVWSSVPLFRGKTETSTLTPLAGLLRPLGFFR